MADKPTGKSLEELQRGAQQDDRIGRPLSGDPRAQQAHDDGASRASRVMNDRPATHNRDISDRERLDLFRQSFFQSSLPNLPDIPGFHLCWLTTTNPRDTVQSRARLGYELVKSDEVPGWDFATQRSSDYPGSVMINEMIAAKLPLHLYQMYMEEAHHHEPAALEGSIRNRLEQMSEDAKAAQGKVLIEDGMEEFFSNREKPDFTDPSWRPQRGPVIISG